VLSSARLQSGRQDAVSPHSVQALLPEGCATTLQGFSPCAPSAWLLLVRASRPSLTTWQPAGRPLSSCSPCRARQAPAALQRASACVHACCRRHALAANIPAAAASAACRARRQQSPAGAGTAKRIPTTSTAGRCMLTCNHAQAWPACMASMVKLLLLLELSCTAGCQPCGMSPCSLGCNSCTPRQPGMRTLLESIVWSQFWQ